MNGFKNRRMKYLLVHASIPLTAKKDEKMFAKSNRKQGTTPKFTSILLLY